MRTTVNLEDDVAAALERIRRERGLGLSEALNELVRTGIAAGAREGGRQRFEQRTRNLGLRIDVTNVERAIEHLDGPAHR
jgi:metal-responsive CopG/Arc/MetJ family transcriptional regulator